MCGSTNVNVIPLSAKVSIDYLIDYRWQSSYFLSKQTNFEITNTVIITESDIQLINTYTLCM